jgi:hypothetical protein
MRRAATAVPRVAGRGVSTMLIAFARIRYVAKPMGQGAGRKQATRGTENGDCVTAVTAQRERSGFGRRSGSNGGNGRLGLGSEETSSLRISVPSSTMPGTSSAVAT